MSEFSDRPFAAGSLFGVRSFAVESDAMLRGPVKPETWQPGINEAKCIDGGNPFAGLSRVMARTAASMEQMNWAMYSLACQADGRVNLRKRPKPPPPKLAPEPKPHTHTVAGLNCRCGFYAYFRNGHNPHHSTFGIYGIVEGFGVVTVGSHGFRASKARIVALVRPDRYAEIMVQAFNGPEFDQVAANYPDVPTFPTLDAALAEFPLTVPEGAPEPEPEGVPQGIAYAAHVGTPRNVGLWQQIGYATSTYARGGYVRGSGTTDETPAERAMRLKRERNTGPARTVGLDGKRRRAS